MSGEKPFIDTNVLLYLLSDDQTKAGRAEELLRSRAIISVQVLNEFVAVARRKSSLTIPEIRDGLTVIRAFCDIRPVDIDTHEHALAICERFGLTTYDALIVAAAGLAGCSCLWTEDMQHGQTIGGVTIANPFTA